MKRDQSLYIKDMLDAIHRIEDFVEDITYEEFVQADKTSSAVIRKLEITLPPGHTCPMGARFANGSACRYASSQQQLKADVYLDGHH